MIQLTVNGKPVEIEAGLTVKKYLESKGVNPNVVACELNLTILRRANLDQVVLQEKDELEIIQMIGGG